MERGEESHLTNVRPLRYTDTLKPPPITNSLLDRAKKIYLADLLKGSPSTIMCTMPVFRFEGRARRFRVVFLRAIKMDLLIREEETFIIFGMRIRFQAECPV
jgi:hypothetical protein